MGELCIWMSFWFVSSIRSVKFAREFFVEMFQLRFVAADYKTKCNVLLRLCRETDFIRQFTEFRSVWITLYGYGDGKKSCGSVTGEQNSASLIRYSWNIWAHYASRKGYFVGLETSGKFRLNHSSAALYKRVLLDNSVGFGWSVGRWSFSWFWSVQMRWNFPVRVFKSHGVGWKRRSRIWNSKMPTPPMGKITANSFYGLWMSFRTFFWGITSVQNVTIKFEYRPVSSLLLPVRWSRWLKWWPNWSLIGRLIRSRNEDFPTSTITLYCPPSMQTAKRILCKTKGNPEKIWRKTWNGLRGFWKYSIEWMGWMRLRDTPFPRKNQWIFGRELHPCSLKDQQKKVFPLFLQFEVPKYLTVVAVFSSIKSLSWNISGEFG